MGHGRWCMLATLGIIVGESATGVSWQNAGEYILNGGSYAGLQVPFDVTQTSYIEAILMGTLTHLGSLPTRRSPSTSRRPRSGTVGSPWLPCSASEPRPSSSTRDAWSPSRTLETLSAAATRVLGNAGGMMVAFPPLLAETGRRINLSYPMKVLAIVLLIRQENKKKKKKKKKSTCVDTTA